jgi:hypothetical protein
VGRQNAIDLKGTTFYLPISDEIRASTQGMRAVIQDFKPGMPNPNTTLLELFRLHIFGNTLLLPSFAFHDLCLCLYHLRFSLIRQLRTANRFDGHAITAPQMLKGVFAESLILE